MNRDTRESCRLNVTAGVWILATALFGCSSPAPSPAQSAVIQSTPETDSPAVMIEEPTENLLRDPSFDSMVEGGPGRQWWVRQHAGEPGYVPHYEGGGTVRIESLGTQPWINMIQAIDVSEHCGKLFRVLADIRLDLTDEPVPHMIVTGAGLLVHAYGPDRRALQGNLFEHTPNHGQHGWRRVHSDLRLPTGCDYVEVGFSMRANGEFEFRNPVAGIMESP